MTIAPEAAEKDETPVPEGHVKLTIDGEEVIAPKGELLIRTAERLGIVIPRFCDHPLLDPAGACRQCLVEVEMNGRPMPKPQASCTMTVADGMVVKTQLTSPVADKAQQGVMELLLINHPLDGVAVRRPQTDVPEAVVDLDAGTAGPRAVRAVPAVHPVLVADRG